MLIKSTHELMTCFHLLEKEAQAFFDAGIERVIIKVKEHKDKRTTLQNSFYWLNVASIAKFMADAGATFEFDGMMFPYDEDYVHGINKRMFGVKTTTGIPKKEYVTFMDSVFYLWNSKTLGEWQPKESTRSYFEKNGYKINDKGQIII
jgi:hypothetical protein